MMMMLWYMTSFALPGADVRRRCAPQDGGHARSASVGSAGGSPLSHWRDRLLAADMAADVPPHGFGSRFTLDALGAADDGADAGRLRWEDEEGGGGGERALWEP